jgi:glycosyltransferase involved in cell wall biosynthesis
MRIAFIADSLPPSTDVVALTYKNLVGTLENKNVEFYFLSPFKPGDDISWSNKVNQVYYVRFLFYTHYRLGLPLMQNLQEKLDQFQPDIIHVSSPTFMGKMGINYANRRQIPAVATYHTDLVSYLKYHGFKLIEELAWSYLRWFYNQFDKILAPSPTTARILESKGFENVTLWQRGIDVERFSPALRDQNLRKNYAPHGEPMLLFVGRLVKEKDLDDLIEVDRRLKKMSEKFKIVVVGDGPMRDELERELPDAVFTGYLHGNDLSVMYASADIFVFPSTTETFGNVILESLASGLPVVTVDKGGVSDLVRNGETGFICKSNSPDDLTEKITLLLHDNELRGKFAKAGQRFAKQFSWNAINSNLLDRYKELISTKPHIQSAA